MKKVNVHSAPQNKVLADNARTSNNFFHSDRMLRNYLLTHLSDPGFHFMEKNLEELGEKAAGEINALSLLADRHSPELIKRDPYGETINEIRFHPSYGQLMEIAIASGMLRVKWEPEIRKRFSGENHSMGFSAFYLFAMSELGQDCPLCMTDGAAHLLDRFATEEVKNRLLPTIYTNDHKVFRTGGMFLTEKSGGSDVGKNLVTATQNSGEMYRLNGEKWFCSNANGEIIFALARTDPEVSGTRGLSIFLVEKYLEDGSRNPIDIIRLKDKLGVRSMASAECLFTDTVGRRMGDEFEGFRIMAEMVNLSRIHNALASVAGGRRALVEAYQFLSFRRTFGKDALDHALIRHKLHELGAMQTGSFYLLWRAIRAFDKVVTGDEAEGELLRQLTPMLKKHTAEAAVYIVRESMELMGGLGYIEDTVMPKLMRDVLVLPIWEGAGNIQVLDMLRALKKSNGLDRIVEEIQTAAKAHSSYSDYLLRTLSEIETKLAALRDLSQEEQEVNGKRVFEKLTHLYQVATMLHAWDEESSEWLEPAVKWFVNPEAGGVISKVKINNLMAWEF